MKKLLTTFAMALATLTAATAQQQGATNLGGEAKLLSTRTAGGYTISRYLVKDKSTDGGDFSLRYKINLSKLLSSYDDNAAEIKGLHSFIQSIKQDSLKQITAVNITGYASPDGPHEVNVNLANARAQDCREYITSHCSMGGCNGTTKGVAQLWAAAAKAIETSQISNKQQVLAIINSGKSQMDIEQQLKAMPAQWNYIVENILPPMRSVELEVCYSSWHVVERRVVNKSAVNESPKPQYIIMMVEQEPYSSLMHLPTAPLDYDEDRVKVKYKEDRRRTKFKERWRLWRGRNKR